MSLEENFQKINAAVTAACKRAGRDPAGIKILLATKSVEPARIRAAAQLGYRLCGENKAQELLLKKPELADVPIEWHFIGHLQSNKVKDAVENCDLIHSVDRLSLAEEISKRAALKNKITRVLIEVNTSGDASKSGVAPAQAEALCRKVSVLASLQIKGLMTIAKESEDQQIVRACFKKLREISEAVKKLKLLNTEMKELSMGMSQDFEIAIEEGATLIRLGSAVFGHRS